MKKYLIALFGIFLISFVQSGVPNPEGDYDSDGILNKDDNCYYVYNPFQTNSDGDRKGDVCDPSPLGYCGDGLCIGDEDYLNCPVDCEAPVIPPFCGDGTCDEDEDCSSCSEDCGTCPEEPNPEPEQEPKSTGHTSNIKQFCEVSWKCSGWTSCKKGRMTRTCYDANHCDYSYNMPNKVAGCEITEKVFVEKEGNVSILFFVGFLTITSLLVLLAVLIKK